jgi:hypothetical protein
VCAEVINECFNELMEKVFKRENNGKYDEIMGLCFYRTEKECSFV